MSRVVSTKMSFFRKVLVKVTRYALFCKHKITIIIIIIITIITVGSTAQQTNRLHTKVYYRQSKLGGYSVLQQPQK